MLEQNVHFKNRSVFNIVLNLFWFTIISFLSYRMPMFVDDYIHINSFATGESITSVSMIPESVYTYYMTWGGRALSMFFIQFMLMLPHIVYAVCNGLIYVVLANTVCAYSHGKGEKTDPVLLGMTYLFIWFFMPDFAEVTIWLTGSITYLWTSTLIIIFGLVYFRDIAYEDNNGEKLHRSAPLQVIGMALLGLCAGLTNEAGACTLMLALVLYMIQMIRHYRRISPDYIVGAISALIGTSILIFAPGNMIRAAQAGTEAEYGNTIKIIFFRLVRESFYTLLYLLVPIVVCAAVCLFVHGKRLCEKNGRTFYAPLFVFLGLVSIYALTFSSGFADRIFQFPLFMMAVSFSIGMGYCINDVSLRMADDNDAFRGTSRAVYCLIIGLMLMALIEVIAGNLYSAQSGTYFDRHMYYYFIDHKFTSGLMPGNGM